MIRFARSPAWAYVAWVVAAVSGLAPAFAQEAQTFRYAYVGEAERPCEMPAKETPQGLQAYAAHLAKRLERPVLVCAVKDRAAAARLIASGGADLALLDPETFTSAGKARAILSPRLQADFGRVEIVAMVKGDSSLRALSDLSGARVVLAGTHPVAAEAPFRALADFGVLRSTFASVTQAGSPIDAATALRSGVADVMLMHVAAWERLCRAKTPGDAPCADLRLLWRSRPRASLAFVVPTSMAEDLRYRIVGIHIRLSLEAHDAFAYLAPGADGIDPAEAGALAIGR